MKSALRKLFSPLLNLFEGGDQPYSYRKSHRVILIVVGCLFLILSGGLTAIGMLFAQAAVILPVVVFFSVSFTALVIGGLGTDRAVSKIWGNK